VSNELTRRPTYFKGRTDSSVLDGFHTYVFCLLLSALFIVFLTLMTAHAQTPAPPSVEITNGSISATIYPPDALKGFYRGTRFDWSGVIGRLTYAGHDFYGPWFTKTDPAVRDFSYVDGDIVAGPQSAITGPVEEFATDGQGLGYAEAAPGGTFVKIGVGVLRKPADGAAYSMFGSYDIVDGGKWTVTPARDSVAFTHEVMDEASGYGYRYTKTLRLTPGQPELVIEHRLTNRGRKPIVSTVYDHNFLVLDGRAPGPDFTITAPFALKTARPLDPAAATIVGSKLTYAKALADRDRFSTPLQGFGATAADYNFTIEHASAGVGMRIIGDRPLSSLSLWSIRSVLALEPFIAMTIEPGAEFGWTLRYQYYVLAAK
jgi:hypothetical protein